MVLFERVSKSYRTKDGEVVALDDVNIEVQRGEFVVVRGPSGSGKTTLLMIAAGMLRPTRGRVFVDESDIYRMSHRDRAKFRAENIGFVFQMFHLLPYLDVRENILLAGGDGDRVDALIDRLGLTERKHHKPAELSAGEKQRVAIARAMLNSPKLILADEPTGNLDLENASVVLRHLSEYRDSGGTVILVTHGGVADDYADRIIRLRSGKIVTS